MNRQVSQTTPSGDDLEQMLVDYFRSEMPEPWPTAPRPSYGVLSRPPRRPVWNLPRTRSQLALAASVAVLLGGLLLLSGLSPLPPNLTAPSLGPGDARRGLPLPTLPAQESESPSTRDGKVSTSTSLEQKGDAPTGIKIEVSELPPGG